jgi:hypothetical protein
VEQQGGHGEHRQEPKGSVGARALARSEHPLLAYPCRHSGGC